MYSEIHEPLISETRRLPSAERRVAVGISERAGWIVHAVAGGADLRERLLVATDEQDATVLRVGDRDATVAEKEGVVGLVRETPALRTGVRGCP